MTLPVALLIACYKNEEISHEIRELIGNRVSILEPLSCKCKDHMNKLHLVPPSPCCSPELSSPTSDLGSEISTGSSFSGRSYSYFSDEDSLEKYRTNDSDEQNAKQFTVLVDVMENVAARFGDSASLSDADEVKILHEGRDILDLGSNIRKPLALTHPPVAKLEQKTEDPPKVSSVMQPCKECGFEELAP